ncbi:hypothetical protein [Streptomyces cyaneofuscatus]|uniref:hypothetical protein n=1 Tax=Streptomyces cyaneofuscatus TaxID=66883 RepID=UPI0033269A30
MNAGLNPAERQFLTFALDLAADLMVSRGDEFDEQDEASLKSLRILATETEEPALRTPERGLITAVRSAKEGPSKWVVRWRENGKPRQRTFHNPTHAKGWRTYLIRTAHTQQQEARRG